MTQMDGVVWQLRTDKAIQALKNGKRLDGRANDEYRKVQVKSGISENAEASCWLKLGETEVIAGIKMLPKEPFPDTPNEGAISVGAEFLSIASPTFETGPPSEESIELSRVVDRGIRESKCLDLESLCLEEGEKVWNIFVDIYALNDDGNLMDASSLASLIALQQAKIPKLDSEYNIVKDEFKGKLKLHRLPVLSTFAKVGSTIVLDPILVEEKAQTARFSVATTEDNYLSAFQKGMGGSFSLQEINEMIEIALKRGKELRKHAKE
ncbi:MAG: exosome complex protein Rrp42 [Candidatus Diapherotrites archaeon]